MAAGVAWFAQQPGTAAPAVQPLVLVALAVVNSAFLVTRAWQFWSVQQVGMYCYSVLGGEITRLCGFAFGRWDKWRKSGGAGGFGVDPLRKQFGWHPVLP